MANSSRKRVGMLSGPCAFWELVSLARFAGLERHEYMYQGLAVFTVKTYCHFLSLRKDTTKSVIQDICIVS